MTETNAEYHADLTHISHSMMEVFRKSPKLYEKYYISKTLEREDSTPAMQFGSLVHCLTLESDRFPEFYMIANCKDRRGKTWKEAVAGAEEAGMECILESQYDEAIKLAEAVALHPIAARLLSLDGVNEQPIRWEHETGISLKCKPDRLITDESLVCMLCVDLKTALHPSVEKFSKDAYGYGYHRQASHYTEGCRMEYDRPCGMVYIVVGKEEPYDVFVYQPDEAFIEKGWIENMDTLAAINECLQSGEWHSSQQNELITLSLPAWARR